LKKKTLTIGKKLLLEMSSLEKALYRPNSMLSSKIRRMTKKGLRSFQELLIWKLVCILLMRSLT
jgi:hypothetical protein